MVYTEKRFEEFREIFIRQLRRDDERKETNARERAYFNFMWNLEELVRFEYEPWLNVMGLTLGWSFDPEDFRNHAPKIYGVSFAVFLKTRLLNGSLDGEPLIEFRFNLNQDKLDDAYTEELFERMDVKLNRCLKSTYGNWMIATSKYHWYLFSLFREYDDTDDPILSYRCAERAEADSQVENPMDNPEKYFLTHEVVILD